MISALEKYDPQMYELIRQEEARQGGSIRLIPSENYVSEAVMIASSSCLTNKYSEGYPGKRYYEGQQVTDLVENLAIARAKKIFKADHANVQPYSGSVANIAAYNALIEPGDTIMGLSLSHGGHLTHGWGVSVTSRFYKSVQYQVDPKTGRLDYNQIEDMAKKYSIPFLGSIPTGCVRKGKYGETTIPPKYIRPITRVLLSSKRVKFHRRHIDKKTTFEKTVSILKFAKLLRRLKL